jgi:hypothetical protein
MGFLVNHIVTLGNSWYTAVIGYGQFYHSFTSTAYNHGIIYEAQISKLYEGRPESIQPFLISQEPVVWP